MESKRADLIKVEAEEEDIKPTPHTGSVSTLNTPENCVSVKLIEAALRGLQARKETVDLNYGHASSPNPAIAYAGGERVWFRVLGALKSRGKLRGSPLTKAQREEEKGSARGQDFHVYTKKCGEITVIGPNPHGRSETDILRATVHEFHAQRVRAAMDAIIMQRSTYRMYHPSIQVRTWRAQAEQYAKAKGLPRLPRDTSKVYKVKRTANPTTAFATASALVLEDWDARRELQAEVDAFHAEWRSRLVRDAKKAVAAAFAAVDLDNVADDPEFVAREEKSFADYILPQPMALPVDVGPIREQLKYLPADFPLQEVADAYEARRHDEFQFHRALHVQHMALVELAKTVTPWLEDESRPFSWDTDMDAVYKALRAAGAPNLDTREAETDEEAEQRRLYEEMKAELEAEQATDKGDGEEKKEQEEKKKDMITFREAQRSVAMERYLKELPTLVSGSGVVSTPLMIGVTGDMLYAQDSPPVDTDADARKAWTLPNVAKHRARETVGLIVLGVGSAELEKELEPLFNTYPALGALPGANYSVQMIQLLSRFDGVTRDPSKSRANAIVKRKFEEARKQLMPSLANSVSREEGERRMHEKFAYLQAGGDF